MGSCVSTTPNSEVDETTIKYAASCLQQFEDKYSEDVVTDNLYVVVVRNKDKTPLNLFSTMNSAKRYIYQQAILSATIVFSKGIKNLDDSKNFNEYIMITCELFDIREEKDISVIALTFCMYNNV